jgi:heptosyltransferase-2
LKSNLSPPFSGVNRILVRGVNWVGDTILTYPTVQKLKTIFPHSHMAILIPNQLIDLWKTFPYIDEIISFQKKGNLGSFWEDLRLGSSLKKKRFDLAMVLPRSFHSAFQAYLARIPIRVGYQDEGRSPFLTHGIPRKAEILQEHRIHYYEKIVDFFGRVEGTPPPRILLREEDRGWAEERLRSLGFLDGRPLIGMNPGATYGLAKCWDPDRFGELGRRLASEWKAGILIFGKEEEGLLARKVLEYVGNDALDLTGKTTLLRLAALLERCRLLLTNDTGTMHVAAAVNIPVVALFGPTNPATTGPWGNSHVVIRKNVPCSPCMKRLCPTDHQCMELITVEEVEEAINKKLEN